MSALESSVREFDRTKAAGVKLLRDNEIDFDEWSMLDAETAKVRPASDWSQDVIDHFSMPGDAQGAMLPWSITHNRIRLRLGELSVWAGVNGHGKSMLLSHVTLDLMVRQSETVCIASLEMRPLATLARMARQATAQDTPGPREVRAFYAALNERLWLYDQQGTIRHDRMLAVVRYAREHLGVNHFVIDSLMKCGINGDDYNVQKRFVDNLATYARDSGLHIHLIAHSRKRESEHKPMDKFDIKGASEITDLADNVFTLWRNKPKEEKLERGDIDDKVRTEPDAMLICDKQRHGEWEGRISLWFNRRAFQYTSKNTVQTFDYLSGKGESAREQ